MTGVDAERKCVQSGQPIPNHRFSLKPSKNTVSRLKKDKYIYLMLLPGVVWVLVFWYSPLYGSIIAFKDYKPMLGIMGSPWVGLKHFESLMSKDFLQILRNTLVLSLGCLFIGFPAPIIFALMVSGIKNKAYRKAVQTFSYVPHFVSWVVVSSICFIFFAPQSGVINAGLIKLGLISHGIGFLEKGQLFVVMMIVTNVWKSTGWSAIIYFSAIAGVDAELYESAIIDGAGTIQKMWYITLPSIMPTILVMLIMAVSNILNAGFEQQMVMANDLVWDWADVIDTYSYRYGLKMLRYSYGSAVGFFKSVISCLLLFGSNKIVQKMTGYSLYS